MLELRRVLPRLRMRFLELAGIVFVFGVALPVSVGVIGEVAGAVDIAKAALAKAGVAAAVGKTAVAKARAASPKAAALETSAMGATKTATSMKTAKAAATAKAECADLLGPERKASGDRGASQ